MLYQVETAGEDPELALARYCESFPYQKDIIEYTRFLLSGIKENKELVDRYITDASDHWKMERTTYIDRNIIRLGVYEMFFSEDVPPKVAIDEAIELGKKYGNEDSGDFINGVLDRVLREYYEKERNVRDEGR
ncbi:MAG: hypothetical protein A4E62_03126 [Syntrophorhabdus sp. PtaU1.Bin002]|nr:MAG: hypothetical protein A4E62_03126 [Syntrophorhabdus sp. PtaU1.Bin002]